MIKKKTKFAVLFESPTKIDNFFISKYIKTNYRVWIIEPFFAHHHKRGFGNYPRHLNTYVQSLIKQGKISILHAKDLNTRDIDLLSGEMAVAATEAVYFDYRKRYNKIITFLAKILKTPEVENVFKLNLSHRLAEFYSVNITLHRIEKCLNNSQLLVYPDADVHSYDFMQSLLLKNKQKVFEHKRIRFSYLRYSKDFIVQQKQNLKFIFMLFAQTLSSGIVPLFVSTKKNMRREFKYGIAITAPNRQLRDNKRRIDFIVDENKICSDDVVFFSAAELNKNHKELIENITSSIIYIPRVMRFFSGFTAWFKLFCLAIYKNILLDGNVLYVTSLTLFNYLRWKKILHHIKIRHFITHADFGLGHIGRNIALKESGVQTWSYTDSMSHALVFRERGQQGMRKPYCAYQHYDHLVTWDEALAQYYKEHPDSYKKAHVVGCIWSQHINDKKLDRVNSRIRIKRNLQSHYIISCFDSTYLKSARLSYSEGIAFALHVYKLVIANPDIYLVVKEKKNRKLHEILDPTLGPKLVEIYEEMDSHERVSVCSNETDASEIISISDLVISFSFSSTTFEAISVNRPAIWHDPLGNYKRTLYGQIKGVTTHSYEELEEKVLETKSMNTDSYRNPFPANSPLMDPFRDGRAIERFGDLLVSAK